MLALPAPLVRGLSVVGIGAAIVLSHLSFATAKTHPKPVPPRLAVDNRADVSSTGSIGKIRNLADNCYWETLDEESVTGNSAAPRVETCD
jgi:hypothetical protein